MRNTKNTYKRLLSVLLCLVMIMALAPMSVFAEDAPLTGQVHAIVSYVGSDGSSLGSAEYYFEGTEGTEAYLNGYERSFDGYVLDTSSSKTVATISGMTVYFTLVYNPVAPATPAYVTVSYVYENMGLPAESVQVPYGSAYTPKSDYTVIDGYKFSGWKCITAGANLSNLTVDCVFSGRYDEDVNNGGKYYVQHYLQNLDGTYALAKETMISGVAAGKASYDGSQALSIAGFKVERADDSSASANIYAELSSPMKIYYARNSYTVTYMVDGKQSGKVETYKFGESVSVRPAPTAKKGYTFVGWDANYALGSGNTMPAANVVFSGTMVPGDGVQYTVNFYRENDAGKYELFETSVRTGVVGKLTTVKAPKIDGYEAKPFTNKTIAADGSTVINVYYDLIDVPYVPVRPSGSKNNAPDVDGTMYPTGGQLAQAVVGEDVALVDDAAEPSVSVENPEVADIADEDTPLASGIDEGSSNISIILYIIIGTCLVLAAAIVYFKNKKLYNV